MMMPMEEMPSSNNSEADGAQTDDKPVPPPAAAPAPANPNPFNCCCKSQDAPGGGISRNQIEPVIFQPINDLYLQLKPHRRIRVIHINGQAGALPTPSPYYLQHASGSDSDDDEYWFQNADPKRPRITQPPVKNVPPKRIFHKLEPQVRPTLEQLSPSNLLNNSIQGRLPRKTIKNEAINDDDDDEDEENDENIAPKSTESSPATSRKNINIPSAKADEQDVITLPEPGESSTDSNDFVDEADATNKETPMLETSTASIEEAGQKLGGMANVAFEAEEDAPDIGIQKTSTDQDKIALPSKAPPAPPPPMYILPALFFVHGVGGSANVWSNQLSYFANLGHEVIAPDLLGHGFSSAPDKAKSYTFTKLLRDILTIYDHFVPRTRECIVIAHSYGCSMAAALTKSRPESVKLLVMCSSGGPTPLCPPSQLSKIPPSFLACLKPFLKCRFGSSQKYKPRGKSTKIQQVFDVPAYVLHHIMMGQFWPEGDAAYHRKIGVPTLLVYGMKDPLVSLVEMCEMERTIPKAYLELIPLAGHMVMQDQSEELNLMLKKFITRYCSPSI